MPGKGQIPANEHSCSFPGVVWGGDGQEYYNLPKTSAMARFWVVWVVVVARGRSYHRQRAVVLVFGGCGLWWWWPDEGPTPIAQKRAVKLVFGVVLARGRPNPRKRAQPLVFEGVGGGVGQRKVQPPETSAMARFLGGRWVVVVVVVMEGSTCPKTSANACFRGGAGKRKPQPSKMSAHACFREVWVVVLARGRYNPRKRAVTLVFGGVWVVLDITNLPYLEG